MSENKNFFRASAEDFKKIPGSPVAYWVSESLRLAYKNFAPLSAIGVPRAGMITGNNAQFVRLAHEVSRARIGFGYTDRITAKESALKWFPYQKGGPFRKYYGNCEYVVNWENDGCAIRTTKDKNGKVPAHAFNEEYILKPNVNWSAVTSSLFSTRITGGGCLFDASGSAIFPTAGNQIYEVSAFLNSPIARILINAINPTVNFQAWEIAGLPFYRFEDATQRDLLVHNTIMLRDVAKYDWDAYETSWDFTVDPLVAELNNPVNPVEEKGMEAGGHTERVTLPLRSVSEASDKSAFQLSSLYAAVRARWAKSCEQMRRLETENNRIFIEAYGLQDELTPEVPWHEITLTCNPWYRYGVKEVEKVGGGGDSFPLNPELEARLKSDTMKELISYAVGCMMGRYAIDKPGLILADQGSTYGDYLAKVSEPEFDPDEDGIIPVIDEDCFADDIVIQFHKFLRTAFGAANFNANLSFIEEAIGKDLRSYFTKDFYGDHLQRYQKRPIYWLFSSPKGTFSALVYLHRYHPGTVGQVLTYLRSHITNLKSRLDAADRTTADPVATQGMKTKAIKERTKLMRQLKELEDYERDVLHPLASERLEIDVDDGVKANYPKFGKALRKIPGFE